MRVSLRRRNSFHEWFASSDLAAPPPAPHVSPRFSGLRRSSAAAFVKVGDAAVRLGGTRLHILLEQLVDPTTGYMWLSK